MVFNTGAALLDGIVLAVVSREAEGTYGYKITQDVRKAIDISESTLYPVLRRLQKENCLETYDMAFDGRNRRYYKLTETGRAQLKLYKSEWTVYSGHISRIFEETAKIEVRGSTLKYVSRGGLKLEKAMTHFGVTLDQKICMDVGASTGGFTDCMLQNGAVKVYSVDVGHGQLAWKLRNDPRVVCMEKTNIRYVTPEEIPDKIQFVSIDVSFISLTKVLGPVKALMEPDGQVVCLIKPQFEAGRDKVGKKGVVRERSVHLEVIRMVAAFAGSIGFEALHLEFSPIKGPEGNIEYLLHLRNDAGGNVYENSSIDAEEIVNQAHETLD